MTKNLQQLIRSEIRELSAYHVPDASGMIKLDAMENPYVLPDELQQAWLQVLKSAPLNRYPDPAANELKEQLHRVMQVPAGYPLMLGNGSDEIIQIICMALADSQRDKNTEIENKILSFDPGFVMYQMIARFTGMQYIGVPLNADDFSLDEAKVLSAIVEHKPAVIFIAYPNNPTGNLFDENTIKKIIAAAPGLVVLDEAYHPFAQTTFMQEINNYSNLLVMRTVSKMGLAGLRLGLLAGHVDWLNEFEKIRLPYNINVLTQLSSIFALQHAEIFEQQAKQIRQQRAALLQQLQSIETVEAFDSQANFILFRVPNAGQIFEKLKGNNILIKNLDRVGGSLKDCLRVTVGLPEENEKFITIFKKCI